MEMGSRALGAWLRRCRESVGEVNGKSFMQLMQSLVESVLLYGAEICMGLPSEVRWVEPTTTKGPENLLWCGCASPKGIPDDRG